MSTQQETRTYTLEELVPSVAPVRHIFPKWGRYIGRAGMFRALCGVIAYSRGTPHLNENEMHCPECVKRKREW